MDTAWSARTESAMVDRAIGHEVSAQGHIPVEPLLCRAYSPAGSVVAATLEDMLRYAGWHLADPELAATPEG